MTRPGTPGDLPLIGWREWLALPELGIDAIKAKIDTGARSSALHAFGFHRELEDGVDIICFRTHVRRREGRPATECRAELLDMRSVKSSNGTVEHRYSVRTLASLAGQEWPIELTLTDRAEMRFPMLLGREALRNRFLIDPGRSFVDPTLRPVRRRPRPHPRT